MLGAGIVDITNQISLVREVEDSRHASRKLIHGCDVNTIDHVRLRFRVDGTFCDGESVVPNNGTQRQGSILGQIRRRERRKCDFQFDCFDGQRFLDSREAQRASRGRRSSRRRRAGH